jgi:CHAT domain-containing protein
MTRSAAGRAVATLSLLVFVPVGLTALYAWYTAPVPVQDVLISPSTLDREDTFRAWAEDDAQVLEELQQQLAAAEIEFGPEHDLVAETAMRLADCQRRLDHLPEARQAYEQVVAIRTPLQGASHWQAREARERLAELDRGDARVRAADAQHRRAEELYRAGKFLDAIAVCREALAQRRAIHGETHGDVADSLALLGVLSYNHGDHYQAAEALLRQAESLLARTRGRDHPAYANCLHWLASLADDRGDFEGATRLYQQALAIHRQARGKRTPEYARTLNRYGRMGITWSQDYAFGNCSGALQIRQQVLNKDHLDCAESLEDLARLALNLFDFDKAERLLHEALAIRQRRQGHRHPDLAETWSWLGAVLCQKEDMAKAHVCHRRAITVTEEARGPKHPLLARYLSNFAQLNGQYFAFSRCERLYKQALQIRADARVDRHPDQADDLTGLGDALGFHFSIQFGAEDFPVPRLEELFEKAIAHFESIPGGTRLPCYPAALCWLAEAYYWDNYRHKSQAQAEALCRKALDLFNQDGGTLHRYYDSYLCARLRIHASRGEQEQAEAVARKAVEWTTDRYGTAYPLKTAKAMHWLAGVYLRQETRHGDTITLVRQLLDTDEKRFLQNAVGQSDGIRIASLYRRYQAISAYLSAGVQGNALPALYRDVLSFRGAAAACERLDRLAHDHAELKDRLAGVEQARRDLARRAFHPPTRAADQPGWQAAVDAASDAKEDQENELALALRPHHQPEPPIEVRDLQKVLPGGTVLIDFLNYQHVQPPPGGRGRLVREYRLVAFLLRPDADPVCVALGPTAAIERAVFDWRQALGGDNNAQLEAVAQEVAHLVWRPLAPHIRAAESLLIAPDGPVCFLSFAALPGQAPRSYLLEEHRIGYVPSGRAAYDLLCPGSAPASRGMLALGGIRYKTDSPRSLLASAATRLPGSFTDGASWPDLPGTGTEARRTLELARQAPGAGQPAELLTGSAATRDAFLAALQRRWRYLHFAGHGFFADPGTTPGLSRQVASPTAARYDMTEAERQVFSRNQLLLSGLVLAPRDGPTGGEENLLTAEEVGGVDLRGTELVVLSACETGLGNTAGGEGVLGLQRALLTAGARNVVTSLWRVDDDATTLLMEEFYKNLWVRNLPKAEALRQAQLLVLRHPERLAALRLARGLEAGVTGRLPAANAPHDRTRLWAAFVLSGDGR